MDAWLIRKNPRPPDHNTPNSCTDQEDLQVVEGEQQSEEVSKKKRPADPGGASKAPRREEPTDDTTAFAPRAAQEGLPKRNSQALACKGMPCDLQNTMTEVIRVVNHIKSSALNSRLFHELCVDMGAEHTHLLFHTQVRWLSKGKVLSRVYELIHEIHSFLLEKNSPLADLFTDSWTLTVAYLSDIFSSLNDLNVKLQGQHDDLFNNWRHVYAFQKSLQLWLARLKQPNPSYYMFPTMLKHIEEHNVALREVMQLNKAIQAHLAALTANFERYYPQERRETLNAKRWIQNPFEFESPESLLALGLTPDEEAELLQLTSDQTLKQRYARTTLSCFWISVSSEFPTLSKRSVLLLLRLPPHINVS
ncbi:hypothetical protein WMY93_024297 [Mugilogobius chulae]|uniref:Uncharacterized protein n=1 Tax=Mugilogobius chulae TaxID=88201 RepID=A0AAW0N3Q9_9GOBI